jgi:anthranilate synthase/indole-3-glycerol phosphate synthase/phosphoribosylanthranilate isomerase
MPPLVKICGIRSKEEAVACADLLRLMFMENSKRHIDLDTAREISQAIHLSRFAASSSSSPLDSDTINAPWFTTYATRLSSASSRPLLVGVFQNVPLATILFTITHAQLDMVQLHGSEPTDWADHIPVPVIRAFHAGNGVEGVT